MVRRVILLERLQAVADLAPKPEEPPRSNYHKPGTNGEHRDSRRVLVAEYLRHYGIGFTQADGNGGDKFVLDECPFNPDHKKPDSYVMQYPSGMQIFHCSHNSCSDKKWKDFRAIVGEPLGHHYDPPKPDYKSQHNEWEQRQGQTEDRRDDSADEFRPLTLREMIAEYPKLDEPVIDGLVRLGETCNIIADPKVGKSWLSYGLALCIILGALWLGKFRCRRGRVLILDNELRPSNIANRIPTVAKAMELEDPDYQDSFAVISLRGRLMDLPTIGEKIVKRIERGQYDAIIVDAWYRVLSGNENDNGPMRDAYNLVDQFAMHTGAAWFLIHHASKGNQGDKRVTDVGAGAGSQSRAADSHIVLREHEDDGAVVMDAAVRSFPPIEPFAIQWDFPLWLPAQDIDPSKLKGRKTDGERKQDARDQEGKKDIMEILESEPSTRRNLRTTLGMGAERLNRLIHQLTKDGEVEVVKVGEHEMIQKQGWSAGLDF